ncbi:hypothetical protein [Amycolatopsis sp. cmx-4-61]|uniref:hypothetical protein n=1 Tax=Amycolatopsis sp. cmx-4-61 TaxID=2790937 RepID=UPI00397BD114
MKVFLPAGMHSRVTTHATPFVGTSSAEIDLLLEVWGADQSEEALVVVEASGSARTSHLVPRQFRSFQYGLQEAPVVHGSATNDEATVSVVQLPSIDASKKYFRGEIALERLEYPLWVRDNARIIVQTPLLSPMRPCPFLKGAAAAEVAANDLTGWEARKTECSEVPDKQVIRFQLLHNDAADLKLDFVSSPPATANPVSWSADKALNVRANLTSITGEANAQRALFLAGALAGLSGGLVPFLFEMLSRAFVRSREPESSPGDHRRPQERLVRAAPGEPESVSAPGRSIERDARSAGVVLLLVMLSMAIAFVRRRRSSGRNGPT